MREIKFRVFDNSTKKMYYKTGIVVSDNTLIPMNGPFMQAIGHNDTANKAIYEGDILRTTIEGEYGDINHYFIVTWVKEWAMFVALLHTEYYQYLKNGAESLDESMFWTYTIETDHDFTICGNIYEHPDYIRNASIEEENTMNDIL